MLPVGGKTTSANVSNMHFLWIQVNLLWKKCFFYTKVEEDVKIADGLYIKYGNFVALGENL